MANAFVPLPIPAGNSSGVAVDASNLLADKTIVISGPLTEGLIAIEGSQDGVHFSPLLTINLISDPLSQKVHAVVSEIRVRSISGQTPESVTLGAELTGLNLFAAIVAPAVAGPGPALDTSAFGPDKTVLISGAYNEIAVEGSNDGVEFNPITTFVASGADVQSFVGVYSKIRVLRPRATNQTPPVVTIGAGPFSGSGSGSQGVQGSAGAQGSQGTVGAQGGGTQGAQGAQGFTGSGGAGSQGNQGSPGSQGSQGSGTATGFQGFQGATGQTGTQGAQGTASVGAQGSQGNSGAAGQQGFQGAGGVGSQGAQGAQGTQGGAGTQGFQGTASAPGSQGTQGTQGGTGLQGSPGGGAQGFQGVQGFQGAQGFRGFPGPGGLVGPTPVTAGILKYSALVEGAAGAVQQPIADTSVINTGATLATYAGGTGLATTLGTYFTLRVKPIANTLTANSTVTLYISGVPSTLTVTILAGSTAVVSFADASLFFFATSPTAIVVDIPAGQAGNAIQLSVTLGNT